MARGANKVVTSSISWKTIGSDLLGTGIDLGKQYLGAKTQAQIDASKRETMEKAAQTDASIAKSKATTVVLIGVGLLAVVVAFKTLKKSKVI